MEKNEILYIGSMEELEEMGKVRMRGEVKKGGRYRYGEEMRVEEVVIRGGGVKEWGWVVGVEVWGGMGEGKGRREGEMMGENLWLGVKEGWRWLGGLLGWR